MSAKRALRDFRPPGEIEAQERAWTVVRHAFPATVKRRRWPSRRAVLAVAVCLLAGLLAFSPAGASVRHWINHALGEPHAAPALFSLPAPGRVLVSGSGGTWIVSADGSSRRLGSWRQASWSPHGLFAAVAGRDELGAVDPRGTLRWTLARPRVRDPSWYAPTGYRVAYLSRSRLRVVAGDGTDDHLVAKIVAPVAPAWRPGHAYQLAYITRGGSLLVRDADTGRLVFHAHAIGISALAWSPAGDRLLALGREHVTVYGPTGRALATIAAPARSPILDGSLSPNGRQLALVEGGPSGTVTVARLDAHGGTARRVLSGAGLSQLAWSPNNRWLLVSWPAADQWVFVRVAGKPRITAVSQIARQFAAAGATSPFPRIEGWCCTTSGALG